MRKLILAAVPALALALGGCNITTASIQQDEAAVAQIISSVRAGAAMTKGTKSSVVAMVCGWIAIVNSDAGAVEQLVAGAPSPKVAAALNAADNAISAASGLCSLDPTTLTIANVVKVWNAWQAAKAAVANAKAAAGTL